MTALTPIRTLGVVALLTASAGAAALDWPFGDTAPEDIPYCRGLVVSGLGSTAPAGDQRTELWLAWNYLVRTGGVQGGREQPGFDEGYARFTPAMGAEEASALLEESDGECGLGRTGWQVTGW